MKNGDLTRVFVSWTGGKESSLACYKAIQSGCDVSYLVNFIRGDRWGHGVDPKLICVQSQAIGIPIIQREALGNKYEYEKKFKDMARELNQVGIQGVVAGHVACCRDWLCRICKELDIKLIEPLWGVTPEQILVDFMNEGFEAIVVRGKAELFDKEWLGRKINWDFLKDLRELKNKSKVHVLGELGEYHTFVTYGPIFKKRVKILESYKTLKDGYWSLDIVKYEISESRECHQH